ncbi:hydroxymethylpyrimidine/phosphomethylpyrimidine kinase [Pararhodobacter sp. CCB-MM2]|uniref:bifunctional hydroxymethylpyrimidine kinase/phosphomethylpyrimidine kinase n=1 Tax=Pararhodobacter sp. CCB-MM2 TaxID=1786003 RepID=UPI0008338F34|nr:hydroxymethylpyrimidine/phosphomethylpyrimidine kinase [Pararhodobacter sp. CCB-MM2]
MTPRALFIGGTDSSGGAGLARDIATATQLGAEACIAVTAVTAQTDAAVSVVHRLPAGDVTAQIRAAGRVGAIKIGMLGSAGIVTAVAEALSDAPLVLDPVLASSSGHVLLDAPGIEAMISDILPRTTLMTPNLPELRMLSMRLGLGENANEGTCVSALIARGCHAVLVKGGHAEPGSHCEDRLYQACGPLRTFRGPRYDVPLRGTGCQLGSAISVILARGGDLHTAVSKARALVTSRFLRRLSTCEGIVAERRADA